MNYLFTQTFQHSILEFISLSLFHTLFTIFQCSSVVNYMFRQRTFTIRFCQIVLNSLTSLMQMMVVTCMEFLFCV